MIGLVSTHSINLEMVLEYRRLIVIDLQHHLFELTFSGALLKAPIPATQILHRVLDIGTGTYCDNSSRKKPHTNQS